jgi:protease I
MTDLSNKRVAILSTHGFEQSELMEPRRQLAEWGATVHVISPETGEIRGWKDGDWGDSVPVDRQLDGTAAGEYDALVLPGGQMNPDILRMDANAIRLIKAFYYAGKPIAAICHAPWLLIEAGIVKGREATSWPSLRRDLENAGANWVDAEVATDAAIITSRNPGDIPAFCKKIAEEIQEGLHMREAA